jgi:hypothetical protein
MLRRAFILSMSVLAIPLLSAAPAPKPAAQQHLTFTRDIAPILYSNCITCHRPGEVAPFSLIDYKDAKKHAKDLATVTESRYMPPWKAEPGHGEFLGERRLTEEQIKLIKNWAAQGAPEGDPKHLPKVPQFAEGWYLGEPDLVVKMPQAYTVPAEGRDVFRVFVLPMDIPEDKYVTAVEFRPSNRKVVHHSLFFLDTTGAARKLDEQDPGIGYGRMGGIGFAPSGGLGGWAPGVYPQHLPNGIARRMKKGSDLILQTHFHPTGKEELEQSSVGIYFAKTTPRKIMHGSMVASRRIDIPPGEKDYKVTASITSPIDVELIGITPHAHLICKEMKVWANFPDGKTQDLIWIKDWDFNWQDQYFYKKPIPIPRGTKVEMEFIYDNSNDNIRNPFNPPRRIRRGEQTHEEMAITFLNITHGFDRIPPIGGAADRTNSGGFRGFLERLGERKSETRPQ